MVYHLWNGLGIFIGTWFLLFVSPFAFDWWGVVSGLSYICSHLTAVCAIRLSGVAVPAATWSGVSVVTTFIWDILLFHHQPANLFLTVVSLALILLGIVGFSLAGSEAFETIYQKFCLRSIPVETFVTELLPIHNSFVPLEESNHPNSEEKSNAFLDSQSSHGSVISTPTENSIESTEISDDVYCCEVTLPTGPIAYLPISSEDPEKVPFEGLESFGATGRISGLVLPNQLSSVVLSGNITFRGTDADVHSQQQVFESEFHSETKPESTLPKNVFLIGLIFSILAGLSGGSIMVPIRLASNNFAGLYSFGFTMLMVPAWVSVIFWASGFFSVPEFHSRQYAPYGLFSGICYSGGNILAILTIQQLGLSVGFAVLNLNLIVTGCYGIFIWKEIKNRTKLMVWAISAFTLLAGTLLLNQFG